MVELELKLNELKRGKGYWEFNNSLLYDKEYIDLVKRTIDETQNQYRNLENKDEFTINDQLLWETLLLMIRGRTILYSSNKKKNKEKGKMN